MEKSKLQSIEITCENILMVVQQVQSIQFYYTDGALIILGFRSVRKARKEYYAVSFMHKHSVSFEEVENVLVRKY